MPRSLTVVYDLLTGFDSMIQSWTQVLGFRDLGSGSRHSRGQKWENEQSDLMRSLLPLSSTNMEPNEPSLVVPNIVLVSFRGGRIFWVVYVGCVFQQFGRNPGGS